MSLVDQFMARHGMEPEGMEMTACTGAFLNHMQAGLTGKQSSILMLPTYLTGDGILTRNEPVTVIDAGGTNLRTAMVTLTETGVRIKGLKNCRMPGAGTTASWEEFISAAASLIEPLARRSSRIGFCFSYPAEITPEHDGKVLGITKQVKITGSAGRMVCASLSEELKARGIDERRCVLLNDTAAALLGGIATLKQEEYGGFVGLVCGTGINTCCSVDTAAVRKLSPAQYSGSMLINLESGGFTELPRGDADLALDAGTADPGACVYEKMVSGAYLGELIRLTILEGSAEGLFSGAMTDKLQKLSCLDTAQTDAFCVLPRGSNPLAKACHTEADRETAYKIIEKLTGRAARLICANLAAIFLLTGEGKDPQYPVCIMGEGSTLNKSMLLRPMLESCMTKYVTETLRRHWVLQRTENVNFLGGAAAALLNA